MKKERVSTLRPGIALLHETEKEAIATHTKKLKYEHFFYIIPTLSYSRLQSCWFSWGHYTCSFHEVLIVGMMKTELWKVLLDIMELFP